MSPCCRQAPVLQNFMKFGTRGHLNDIITCVKFLVNWLRCYRFLTLPNCHFPLTCCVALTTMYALSCDTVIEKEPRAQDCVDFRTISIMSPVVKVRGVVDAYLRLAKESGIQQ